MVGNDVFDLFVCFVILCIKDQDEVAVVNIVSYTNSIGGAEVVYNS